MKNILTIRHQDFFPADKALPEKTYQLREAARAIVYDRDGRIALLYVSKKGYYKLPGGGVDPGETILEALQRECIEEIGCAIKVKGELSMIVEYRDRYKIIQKSYCYIAEVQGEKGVPQFVGDEIDDGFKVVWVSQDQVKPLLKGSNTETYDGKFICKRELAFIDSLDNSHAT